MLIVHWHCGGSSRKQVFKYLSPQNAHNLVQNPNHWKLSWDGYNQYRCKLEGVWGIMEIDIAMCNPTSLLTVQQYYVKVYLGSYVVAVCSVCWWWV